ncbi:hypothetical protein EV360DRAFT_97173 [Lentinula raphanica]|nr:hypothetical protein EV360DRAFT_97173 [Lentinula raphanica]
MISRHIQRRTLHTLRTPRARDSTDVLIIGGGPAGLSAAIRIKQLTPTLRVVVLEKGSEIGSHILSGCVLEPSSFYRLLGDDISTYEEKYGCGLPPLGVPARGKGEMVWLTNGGRTVGIPHPPQMGNRGNWVLDSLSGLVRWMGRVAEEVYGVEVYAGFGGARVVYGEEEEESPWVEWGGRWGKEVTGVKDRVEERGRVPRVVGVLTNDVGISKKGEKKEGLFTPGMLFESKLTLFAEGAHGSLSKSVIEKFNLRGESDPQTYGMGIKEVWRLDSPENHLPGSIIHTLGFPLDLHTYGGGWVYHLQQNLLSIGLVVGLDYANPTRSPYRDFQKLKHHPYFRSLLSNATRVAYGARVLTEGGLQSLPLLHFPGGALIGDSAGTVNVAKIKGVHNAMGTGMLAAESIAQVLSSSSSPSLSSYTSSFLTSPIFSELYSIRNLRPSFHQPNLFPFSLLSQTAPVLGGIIYSGIDSLLFKGRVPFTLSHSHSTEERARCRNSSPSLDSVRTQPTSKNSVPPVDYPAYDPPLSTDLLTSLALTNTFHEEDQPEHLRLLTLAEANARDGEGRQIRKRHAHTKLNVSEYASLLERACPAGVYEYVDDPLSSQSGEGEGEGWGGKKLVINAQNCIHCKLCDIKVPSQDITWTVPEGGGGPGYTIT